MNSNAAISWDQVMQWLSDPVNAAIVGGAVLLLVLGFCSIFARAGYHWALGLLMTVPGVNVIVFLMLAFGSWPSSRELRSLRRLENAVSKAENRHARAA